jgi:Kef-type K+ transport system membrane component KefB
MFDVGLPPLLAVTAAADAPFVLAGVLLSLIVIYLASKIGGELCVRVNLPPVLGELLGGVIVGVSGFHLLEFAGAGIAAESSWLIQLMESTAGLVPSSMESVFESQSEVISLLSELGVILLLFEIGLESDLAELIRVGPQAAIVASVGVVTPFVLGTVGLITLFHMSLIPAVFAGAALTATSIGITAKVLSELGQLKTREGQIIIGAAVLDDILGIIVLAVVSSLAKTGEIQPLSVVILLVSATAFLVGGVLVGRWLGPAFVSLVNSLKTRGNLVIAGLLVALVLAYVGAVIHLEAILGAFVAGLILGETEKKHELEEQVKPIADVLVPIFFVCVGAKTDLSVLNPMVQANREGLIIAAFLVVVAIIGKVVTGFTVWGQGNTAADGTSKGLNRLAIGFGMIPRGEVGLVFAGVGSASGILPGSLNAAIIVMVIVTTFVAPPLLRVAFGDGSTGEAASSPK